MPIEIIMTGPCQSWRNTFNLNSKCAAAFVRDQRGFTLAELMVASAVGVVVMLFVGVLIFASTVNHAGAINRLESESELVIIEGLLKRTLRQAVNVYKFPGGAGGWIRPFDSTSGTDPTAGDSIVTFGLFQREAATQPEGAAASLIRATGLFFVRPTLTTQGVLFVDADGDGDGLVSPSYGGQYVGHITKVVVPDARWWSTGDTFAAPNFRSRFATSRPRFRSRNGVISPRVAPASIWSRAAMNHEFSRCCFATTGWGRVRFRAITSTASAAIRSTFFKTGAED